MRCPEYEPAQSSYMCCECNERINIGDEYIKNDNDEYMHYDCIPGDRQFIEWLGYEIKEMEERSTFIFDFLSKHKLCENSFEKLSFLSFSLCFLYS